MRVPTRRPPHTLCRLSVPQLGTLRFLEAHPSAFPKSDIRQVCHAVRPWVETHLGFFQKAGKRGGGVRCSLRQERQGRTIVWPTFLSSLPGEALNAMDLHKLLRESGRDDICDMTLHEALTLIRAVLSESQGNTQATV